MSHNFDHTHVHTWIESAVDLAFHRLDHQCVCQDFLLPYNPVDSRRRFHCVSRPDFAPFPDVHWNVDAHTHAAKLQQWLASQQRPVKHWCKQHPTDETKQLIDAKRHQWKRLCDLRRHVRLGTFRAVFEGWRKPASSSSSFSSWIRQCDHDIAWHQWAYADLAPRVVVAVRADDAAFYENLAAHAGAESAHGCQRIWQAIKHVLPKWRNKTPWHSQQSVPGWRVRPVQGLRGVDRDGRFRTAHAEEYALALCRTLIIAILTGLKHRISQSGVRTAAQLTANEQCWVQHLLHRAEVLSHETFCQTIRGIEAVNLSNIQARTRSLIAA